MNPNNFEQNPATKVQILDFCDEIVRELKNNGFIIQRYISITSNSVYLKLDYGVMNSIRISDHKGKQLSYRYNVIIGGTTYTIKENGKFRYFYGLKSAKQKLLKQIILDKRTKMNNLGTYNYNRCMRISQIKHQDEKGFWDNAEIL